MTIAFTGGGTGGHFYPIIAVAEAVHDLAREQRLVAPRLYYLAPTPFDQQSLFDNGISYIRIPAGKMRRYFSLKNFSDFFITGAGFFAALAALYRLYPDVVLSKGGYGAVPATLAARVLGIPVIIHESDAKPGRANLLASKWASKIAISFDSAAKFFPAAVQGKIARTGIPVRKELTRLEPETAREYLHLEKDVPTVLILGGSQGSTKINNTVLDALPALVAFANVIHQCGEKNEKEIAGVAKVILSNNPANSRYHVFGFLNALSLERAAGAADVVVARAGAGTIAEIAAWKKPGILIPIPESVSHDQRTNAYSFADTGAAVVIEEGNLTPHILASECKRITGSDDIKAAMSARAASFSDPDAARVIASALLEIALSHEDAPQAA